MLVSEFVNTIVFGMLKGTESRCTQMSNIYQDKFFFVPRIYCKDGFNISIQVNRANYCASENGTRTFGLDWKLVLIDELCEEHGGVDLAKTLQEGYEKC